MTKQKNFALPLAFIALMFFAIGFAFGISAYLVPVLKNTLGVKGGLEYLVIAANFVPFLIFPYFAAKTIKAVGYKNTMVISFAIFACAFAIFIPATHRESFALFILASFVSGTGNAFLQAAVNPYITLLGPLESAAKRICIAGICNKLAWPAATSFLVLVTSKTVNNISIEDLSTPFIFIIVAFVALGILALLVSLPEVKAVGEDKGSEADCPYAENKTSIWQFPHLILGFVALFIYVGVETLSLSTAVDYAVDTKQSQWITDWAGYIPSIGMVIGYIAGIILIPKYLSQSKALVICSLIAVFGSICLAITPVALSIWFIGLLALGCSLMWPAIWPLAIKDLGRFTKSGASLLTMAIAGGALMPIIFGVLKNNVGMQNAYWICLPCFLFILYYGLIGHKVRNNK